jgi:hypothetical protein
LLYIKWATSAVQARLPRTYPIRIRASAPFSLVSAPIAISCVEMRSLESSMRGSERDDSIKPRH